MVGVRTLQNGFEAGAVGGRGHHLYATIISCCWHLLLAGKTILSTSKGSPVSGGSEDNTKIPAYVSTLSAKTRLAVNGPSPSHILGTSRKQHGSTPAVIAVVALSQRSLAIGGRQGGANLVDNPLAPADYLALAGLKDEFFVPQPSYDPSRLRFATLKNTARVGQDYASWKPNPKSVVVGGFFGANLTSLNRHRMTTDPACFKLA